MSERYERKRAQAVADAAFACFDVEARLDVVKGCHVCFKGSWNFERDNARYQRAVDLVARQYEIRCELMALLADVGSDSMG